MTSYLSALLGSLACVLAVLAVSAAVLTVRDWWLDRQERIRYEDAMLRRGFRKAARNGWVKHTGERR